MIHNTSTSRDWIDLDNPPNIPWPPAGYAAPLRLNDPPDPEAASLGLSANTVPEMFTIATGLSDNRVARMRVKRVWAARLRWSPRIDWKSGRPRELFIAYAQWDTAVEHAADGDTDQLVALLRSATPLHRDARNLVAELLVCRQISRKPGRQTAPGRVSPAQGEIQWQAALYRDHRNRKRLNHDEALRQALVDYKTEQFTLRGEKLPSDDVIAESITDAEIERLHGHIRGKLGASRRVRKRRRG